jgi:ferrous iron transport protein B
MSHSPADCATCPAHSLPNLVKLGVDMENWDYVVALAGNPNTGKSTVFNALTGLRQQARGSARDLLPAVHQRG